MRPFTQPWADAFGAAVNESDQYRETGKGWVWPVALVLEARPELGYEQDAAMVLDLHDGSCRGVTMMDGEDVDAPYVIRGNYETWKAIIKAELNPIAALMRGKLGLTGSLATIVRYAQSAEALVGCATTVATEFPDESPAADP